MTGGDRVSLTPVAVAERWIHLFNAHDVQSLVRLYLKAAGTRRRVFGLCTQRLMAS
jgi:hypothetical protein